MTSTKLWRPLPLPSATGLPALLVAFDMGQSDYTIRITDLANVWSESLDRKSICIRAWGDNTTIDPSDTPENMRKFLATLQSAVDVSNDAHDQTEISLSKGSDASAGGDRITLKATCQLPGFQPLVWSFHLNKSPPSAITSQLVVPLIEAHYYKSRQVDSLLAALKYKDAVVAKLADKLEATGTGLEHVFTALSGKKKVTRANAQDKIKGLGPFSERELRAELQKGGNQPSDSADLVDRVFGGRGLQYHSSLNLDEAPALDIWWQDFQSTSSLAHRGVRGDGKSKARTPSPVSSKRKGQEDDDDEFQVQSTPPHLRSAAKEDKANQRSASPPSSDSPIQSKKVSQEASKHAGKKIGTIGGKKQSPAPRASPSPPTKSPTPPPPPKGTSGSTATAPAIDDDETASETGSDADETASLPEDEVAASSSPPKPPPPSSPKAAAPPSRKGGIGRIAGGARAAAKRAADATPSDDGTAGVASESAGEPIAKTTTTAAPPKKVGLVGKRMGVIGGPSASSSAANASEDADRGRGTSRAVAQEETVQQPRETSQERADRKREELKKELEKKAAAGPAKKKRRF